MTTALVDLDRRARRAAERNRRLADTLADMIRTIDAGERLAPVVRSRALERGMTELARYKVSR